MKLTISNTDVSARPGGWIDIDFVVENDGDIPFVGLPRFVGLPPGWDGGAFTKVELAPNAAVKQRVNLRVGHQEPRGEKTVAIQIDAESSHKSSAAVLTVATQPTDNVDVHIEPRVAVGGQGHFILSVRNDSRNPSRPLSLDLSGQEVAEECEVLISPSFLELGVGEIDSVELTVRGRRPLVGGATPRPIRVTIADISGERWEADAHLRQTPKIPRWLIVTLVVLVFVAVWLAVLVAAVRYVRTDPPDEFDELAVAETIVDDSSSLGAIRAARPTAPR